MLNSLWSLALCPQVSPQDKQPPGVMDRVVRITGAELEQLMRAVALIVTKLSENPNYSKFTSSNMSYTHHVGIHSYGGPPPGYNGSMMGAGGGGRDRGDGQRTEVTIPVPEARVGAIIGKGGEVISQLKNVVGVRIRISEREDFVPGTRNRKVTISGAPEAVSIAQVLIQQKISQSAPPLE